MRGFTAAFAALTAAAALCFPAAAETENLMSGYGELPWAGRPLVYSAEHKTLSFGEYNPNYLPYDSAFLSFPTDGAEGLWFYVDAGSYENGGEILVSVDFLDASGAQLEFSEPEKTEKDGSFHRYQLGLEDKYAAIPENTEKIRVSLHFDAEGETPYFRNFFLKLGGTETAPPEWTVSDKLELVQTKVSSSQYWTWVFIIATVPILLFAARKMKERAGKIK